MFSDFCLSRLLICIVIIGDRPTGLYYNFCLLSLLICRTVIIGDKPTGLYIAYNYRFMCTVGINAIREMWFSC